MIITLTPNPSIDRTVAVASLRHGEVHRATSSRVDPGGKGVNVSRALTAQGIATSVVLPVGGPEGHLMEELLDEAGVRRRSVSIDGVVRMNVAVVEPDGTTTKINEPGPALGADDIGALLDAMRTEMGASVDGGAGWVVACGSLAPGTPDVLYREVVAVAREVGWSVAVDSSGSPMIAALGATPDLIKPNREELEEIVGRRLLTLGDVVDAATGLVTEGLQVVAVSLGADGALLVDADGATHAAASVVSPVSTVGAGDCMLAGLLGALAAGADRADALATGVLWGAAAVSLPGSQVPTPADLVGITVTVDATPDRSLLLSD